MTEREHTATRLARALEKIPGVPQDMIERARTGHYHDYLSPLDTPEIQLVAEGAKLTVDEKTSPAEACDALAARLLSGGQCQHCRKLVTLNPAGAVARDVTLLTGKAWTAAEQEQAGLCCWTRDGARWERGCA